MTHLTEEERQGVADGSLEPPPHLEGCAECAADVDRIRRFMKRVDEARAAAIPADVDEMWPSIRSRIEEKKVVVLPASDMKAGGGNRRARSLAWAFGGLAAAGILGLWIARGRVTAVDTARVAMTDTGVALVALVDSTHAYQEEARVLLDHLELQKAMLRPDAARALERDLKVIDVAIAELQDAIRNDPANPALRRLLASSYRQKVDLLRRLGNAAG